MSQRYFAAAAITGSRATLDGPEAQHLAQVMRARPGTVVTLFDGSGAEFEAEVQHVERSRIELAILSRREISRELPSQIELAAALPKGDRQKWLVEKAVELGVARLTPLRTERGVAQPVDAALARLRRTVVEASKQCGRNRLMQIAAPEPWPDYAAAVGAPLRLLAHRDGRPLAEVLQAAPELSNLPAIVVAIGPEGGFNDDELRCGGEYNWSMVSLGLRTLRVETAAIAAAAMLAGWLERH